MKKLKTGLLGTLPELERLRRGRELRDISMIEEFRYISKRPFRARGHAELVKRVEGVFSDIDAKLLQRDRVSVLELGCGFGSVLLELRQRYGPRIELHGINRRSRDGDTDAMIRNGIERDLIEFGAPLVEPLPTISYADAANGLPFSNNSFDIVYSQVSWRYFGNKIGVLREVSRTLRDDGVAKIDADELRPGLPEEYRRLVEIWQNGQLVPFCDYIKSFGMALIPTPAGEYLRFGKSLGFGEDLEQVLEINLSKIQAHWNGIKCVYRMKQTEMLSGI